MSQLENLLFQLGLFCLQLSAALCKVCSGVNLHQVNVVGRVLKDAFDEFGVCSGCQLLSQECVFI